MRINYYNLKKLSSELQVKLLKLKKFNGVSTNSKKYETLKIPISRINPKEIMILLVQNNHDEKVMIK